MTTVYTGWARLSLMGHLERIGLVGEAEMYGGKLLRIDIPSGESTVTEYYGTNAIYSLQPISEEVARKALGQRDMRPVNPLGFRDPTPEEIDAEVKRRTERAARGLPNNSYADDDDDRPF